MSKEPAGSTTSSGQSAQSRNVSPGLKLRGSGSVAGAAAVVCGAGWTTGGDTGAGAGPAGGGARTAGGGGGGAGGVGGGRGVVAGGGAGPAARAVPAHKYS